MAANPRFEVNSSVADGYSNQHRSHFSGGPSIERNPSFREGREARTVMQTGSGYPGSGYPGSSNSVHESVATLTQILSLDYAIFREHKYNHQVELRRVTNAALGLSVEDSASGNLLGKPLDQLGPEELKLLRASVHDNLVRARERSRWMQDAISKFDGFQFSMQPKKRSRTELSVHERSIASSVERSATTGNSAKNSICSSPIRTNSSDAQFSKADEKKGAIPNKRVRTSTADVQLDRRSNVLGLQRSTGVADRERDSFRPSSLIGGPLEDKEQVTSTSTEGWEKSKLKGRRSGTKTDSTAAATCTGGMESERDRKWGLQHRLAVDGRSRPNEGHRFRSGPVHGIVSMHKAETSSHQNSLTMRTVSKTEANGPAMVVERGEKFSGMEKDRSVSRSGLKPIHPEENHRLSMGVTKSKAARAPRSSLGSPPNPPSHASPQLEIWDHHNSNKAQLPIGSTNRKRSAPSGGSSSPPLAQWVGQRLQKARGARRMNVVPPIALSKAEPVSNSEGATGGARSNPLNSAGSVPVRKVATTSISTSIPAQVKAKSDRVTASTGHSESEESEGDVKSKGNRHANHGGRFTATSQRMGSLVSSPKRSHTHSKEEGIDSARRHGRSGRPIVPAAEDVTVNPKLLRSGRPGHEKADPPIEIKSGRPVSKKNTSEHKPNARLRRPVSSVPGDLSGESDDDHKELEASVQAAIDASATACSSIFWKQMEPYFAFVTHKDREFLRMQVKSVDVAGCLLSKPRLTEDKVNCTQKALLESASDNRSIEPDSILMCKAFNKHKDVYKFQREQKMGAFSDWLENVLPLSQRLLSALIIVGDSHNTNQEDVNFRDSSDCARDGRNIFLKDNGRSSHGLSASNGHKQENAVGSLQTDENGGMLVYDEKDSCNHMDCVETGSKGNTDEATLNHNLSSVTGISAFKYGQMSLNDRIYLELQSIDLLPEPVPDLAQREDDEIGEEINKFYGKLQNQVSLNNERICKLENLVVHNEEDEKRSREHLAMTKLIETSYCRRMGCRGTNLGAAGSKGPSSKSARSAALSFAKRTLARWKKYLETGQSCFTDAVIREALFSAHSEESEAKALTKKSEAADISTAGNPVGEESKPPDTCARLVSGTPVVSKLGERLSLSPSLEKSTMKAKNEPSATKEEEEEGEGEEGHIDISQLPLQGMDELVSDLSGQGQDLGSWLDFEDPVLQDSVGDLVGLDVPMDDISDLAGMMM